MRFEEPEKVYRGTEYEYDLVGQVDIDKPEYWEELQRLQEKAQKTGWQPRQKNSLPFRESLELAKKFQPWDPTNPQREFARELRLALADKLGLAEEKDLERLKIFTAVGSPLDSHGIDFFFSWKTNSGHEREHLLFFDITKNPQKEGMVSQADVVIEGDIPDLSDPDFDEKKFLDTVDRYAEWGYDILRDKMAREAAKSQVA